MRKPRTESKLKQKIRTFLLTNPLMIYKTTNGQILTRDATRVLVCCIYDNDDMFYFGHMIQTNFIDAYLGNSMNHIEIFSALQYLESLELIKNLSGTPDKYMFNPTHEGMHFFELRRKNFIYLMVNSVLLPLFIAIVTTLITLALNGVL
ncbi:hypothetical protein [Frisingicoccus sp.]|uniref:hypothetical protein n=1 Tax=Frisingicoccus sp. TaxID=1918627 RepID=UPI002E794462|nr:hypothetical protein [Frisingicoccus sp.]MEE0752130.1 hypothetical protein [Frisingicoccus sp.]